MIDIFLKEDVHKLLKMKKIVFMGDSNVRALYKDFLCMLTHDEIIAIKKLREKMEDSVYGDRLEFHGQKHNGRNYREERAAKIKDVHVSFYFLTRVFDEYVEKLLKLMTATSQPDVVIINSCVWDLTRWGSNGVESYKRNTLTLLRQFKKLMPDALIIWLTTPPVAVDMKGGFLIKELQFLKYSLRFHIMEANFFSQRAFVSNGFDVLDVHHYLRMQLHRRAQDGLHWMPSAIRFISNLLLTHISLAWDVSLPHRHTSDLSDDTTDELQVIEDEELVVKPQVKDNTSRSNSPVKKPKAHSKRTRKISPIRYIPNISRRDYEQNAELERRKQRIRRWDNVIRKTLNVPQGHYPASSTPCVSPQQYGYAQPQHVQAYPVNDSGYSSNSSWSNFSVHVAYNETNYFNSGAEGPRHAASLLPYPFPVDRYSPIPKRRALQTGTGYGLIPTPQYGYPHHNDRTLDFTKDVYF